MNLKHFTYISLTGAVIISILYLKPPQPLPVVHPSEMPSPTEIIQFKKDKKEFKKFKMHIDGIQEITLVDNYAVKLKKI